MNVARPTLILVIGLFFSCQPGVGRAEDAAVPPAAETPDAPPAPANRAAGATAPAPGEGEERTASQKIDELHRVLTEVMQGASELSFQERYDALAPAVVAAYDLEFMAMKGLGPRGKQLTHGERERWLSAFTRFTVANYARRFHGYSGQFFETLSEEPAPRDDVVVRTRLVRPHDNDVNLDYRMRVARGEWRIIDVYLNGTVSELALRRSEFVSLLEDKGFAELVASVDRHAAKP